MMKYAARLSPRSIITSGRASSAAGLTATAVRDEHNWALEAGDAFLCCHGQHSSVTGGIRRESNKTACHLNPAEMFSGLHCCDIGDFPSQTTQLQARVAGSGPAPHEENAIGDKLRMEELMNAIHV